MYSRVKLPIGIYQKWKWSSPNNGFWEYRLLKHKRDNTSQQSRRMFNLTPKLVYSKWTRHIIMRNGECILRLYTLHEGVHKKCTISISNYQIHETSWQCYDTAVQWYRTMYKLSRNVIIEMFVVKWPSAKCSSSKFHWQNFGCHVCHWLGMSTKSDNF